MAVFADKLPDINFCVLDTNADRIAQWNSSALPIFEPGLTEIINRTRGRNLFFEVPSAKAFTDADMIFISVNTPTKTSGEGAHLASELCYWEQSARSIMEHTIKDVVVVEKSTVPLYTANAIEKIFKTDTKKRRFVVLSNPEFLAEGTAIKDLENPDRVLIGGNQDHHSQQAVSLLSSLYSRWIPKERILHTNVWSGELSKLTANAMLAQRISSINAISALCEKSGAVINHISRVIGMDHRLGPHFLEAGIGFGGSCFRKDILSLVYILSQHGLSAESDYWKQVITLNDHQLHRFFQLILSTLFNTITNKKIAVLGTSFKPHTNDTRDSPAINLCRKLLKENANLSICDPQAIDNTQTELGLTADHPQLSFTTDPYQATKDAHAIILMTHWPQFESLNYQRILQKMTPPPFFFDGRGKMPLAKLQQLGFHVHAIGHPPLLPS